MFGIATMEDKEQCYSLHSANNDILLLIVKPETFFTKERLSISGPNQR